MKVLNKFVYNIASLVDVEVEKLGVPYEYYAAPFGSGDTKVETPDGKELMQYNIAYSIVEAKSNERVGSLIIAILHTENEILDFSFVAQPMRVKLNQREFDNVSEALKFSIKEKTSCTFK